MNNCYERFVYDVFIWQRVCSKVDGIFMFNLFDMFKIYFFGVFWWNFYGCFKGKGLCKFQEVWLDEDLVVLLSGKVSWDDNFEWEVLDLVGLFGGCDLWLEIGFGGGEYMIY